AACEPGRRDRNRFGASAGALSRRLAIRNHYHCRALAQDDAGDGRAVFVPAVHAVDRGRGTQGSAATPADASFQRGGTATVYAADSDRGIGGGGLCRDRLLAAVFA